MISAVTSSVFPPFPGALLAYATRILLSKRGAVLEKLDWQTLCGKRAFMLTELVPSKYRHVFLGPGKYLLPPQGM